METSQPLRTLMDGSINVYFLAAKEDEDVCVEIKKHLTPVIRNSEIPIQVHGDFEILPGQDLNSYQAQLYEAEIVLAFISVDFINNDDVHKRFMKAIDRYNKRESILLQILVRNCMWKSYPYKELQILPRNEQPLNNKQFWNSEDDALTSVAYEIFNAINSFVVKKPAGNQGPLMPGTPAADDPLENVTDDSQKASESYEIVIEDPTVRKTIKRSWRRSYFLKTLSKRGISYVIDILFTFIPVYALVFGMYFAATKELPDCGEVSSLFDPAFWCHFNFYVVPTMGLVFICALFEASRKQATIGKMIIRMQTADLKGNRLSFGKSLRRNILRFLIGGLWVLLIPELIRWGIGDTDQPNLLLILGLSSPLLVQIGYFFQTKKIIHDRLTKTVVGERLGVIQNT